jgi:AcrR family transcriptional regulator
MERVVRLTREQSQARTRARLLEAAGHVFGEKGFAASSLDEIAERAGYSRGAVYSNFEDKDDLFLALLAHTSDQLVAELEALAASVTSLDEFVIAFREFGRRRGARRGKWFLLFNEFRAYALRKPTVRRRLAEHERKVRAVYERMVVGLAAHLDVELTVPPAQAAMWIHAVTNGAEILHELDPETTPPDAAFEAISFFWSRTARPAR